MIPLTERKQIIESLKRKKQIPQACIGPGNTQTGRFQFDENPVTIWGRGREQTVINIDVAFCPLQKRMPEKICGDCILFLATELIKGKPLGEIKHIAGIK